MRRILALSECPDGELVDRQLRLAAEILARNEQGVPVGREALEALPPSALGAVIAQAASLAAGVPVTIEGANAVNKSWPGFFEVLKNLGACVETEETEG